MADRQIPEFIEKQIAWYGKRAGVNRRTFLALKAVQIVLAAAIPVVALFKPDAPAYVNGALGAIIGVIEAFQQLGQFQQNWIRYRSVREAVRRDEMLFAAGAGVYAKAADPVALFAERFDALVAAENAGWQTAQQQVQAAAGGKP